MVMGLYIIFTFLSMELQYDLSIVSNIVTKLSLAIWHNDLSKVESKLI